MPKRKPLPSYRLHKARGCAVVTINGRNHYLGEYGSPASREKYARLIGEYAATGSSSSPKVVGLPPETTQELTIMELAVATQVPNVE